MGRESLLQKSSKDPGHFCCLCETGNLPVQLLAQEDIMAKAARKKLSVVLKRQLLMEAGYRCGNPRCPTILAVHLLEDHHIEYVSDGGGNSLDNLLALCPNCHTLHHHEEITQEAIRHWKGMLLALNAAFDRVGVDLLRCLYPNKDNPAEHWYTADGVLRFASLVADGLVTIGPQISATPFQVPESKHQVRLSERGALLIEAWMAENGDKYRALIDASRTASAPPEA